MQKSTSYAGKNKNLKIIIEKGVNKKNYILDYINSNKDESGIKQARQIKTAALISH